MHRDVRAFTGRQPTEEMPPLALAIAPASKIELGDFSMFNFRTMKFPEQEGPLDMETDKVH